MDDRLASRSTAKVLHYWMSTTNALISLSCISLTPKPPPIVANLKRKRWKFQHLSCILKNPSCQPDLIISAESTSPTKKYKKTLAGKLANGKESWDLQDQATLNRRAERFQREHQIERQKWVGNGQSSFHRKNINAHQDVFSSASSLGNWDEPENDIVTFSKPFQRRYSYLTAGHATQDRRHLSGVIQGLSPTHIRAVPFSQTTTIAVPQPRSRNLIQRKSDRILCCAKLLIS